MATSTAKSVDQYLSELPPDRREIVSSVRDLILSHLPAGYGESMNWGMIAYEIPLERYPNTYNGQPLAYVALASQKNHIGLYLMSIVLQPESLAQLKAGFADAGKRLDVGKSCVRFRTLDDLAIPAVGRAIASMPPDVYIAQHEANRAAAMAKPASTPKPTVTAKPLKKKTPVARAAKAAKKATRRVAKARATRAAKPARAKAAGRKIAAKTAKKATRGKSKVASRKTAARASKGRRRS